MDKQHILVGKTITGLTVSDDRERLVVSTTDGDITATVDAECCSYTWIENVELPALGFPAMVVSVCNLDMPGAEDHVFCEDPDEVEFYGLSIKTDKGEIVIDYRNSSNGYYGGSLCWPSSLDV